MANRSTRTSDPDVVPLRREDREKRTGVARTAKIGWDGSVITLLSWAPELAGGRLSLDDAKSEKWDRSTERVSRWRFPDLLGPRLEPGPDGRLGLGGMVCRGLAFQRRPLLLRCPGPKVLSGDVASCGKESLHTAPSRFFLSLVEYCELLLSVRWVCGSAVQGLAGSSFFQSSMPQSEVSFACR